MHTYIKMNIYSLKLIEIKSDVLLEISNHKKNDRVLVNNYYALIIIQFDLLLWFFSMRRMGIVKTETNSKLFWKHNIIFVLKPHFASCKRKDND